MNTTKPAKTKPVVVTGIQPSGKLHIGNYLGMLKNAIALQNAKKHRCFYFIADYHALTRNYDPKEKEQEIFEMTVDAIAAGINPKLATFFMQSHIAAHTNLSWLFGTLTSTGRLGNMIEYKEKVQQGHTPNLGLFSYPVLMAADILIYNANLVPVGDDQRQHLELARDTATAFNARFGDTFTVPNALLTKTTRVMSLSDPTKKMSKSLPSGCVYLSDTPESIKDKFRRAVTDSEKTISFDPEKRPGISNLIQIFSEFSGKSIAEIVAEYENAGYAKFKDAAADCVIAELAPFRARREELLRDKNIVLEILKKGQKTAERFANEKLREAKQKAGLILPL